jgi:hypothetical protein
MGDALIVREDHVQLFQLYTFFGGNTARVSAVSRVPEDRIKSLAHDNDWKTKINGLQRLDTDEGKTVEREVNRVSIYVSADRLDKVFDTIIADLDSDPSFARAFCTVTDEEGEKSFSTKNLVELAKGKQILADVKYRALGDKMAAEADTSTTMKGTTNLVVNVYQALQSRFGRMPVIDATTRIAQGVVDAHANGPAAD